MYNTEIHGLGGGIRVECNRRASDVIPEAERPRQLAISRKHQDDVAKQRSQRPRDVEARSGSVEPRGPG